jgi:hypothetical protein
VGTEERLNQTIIIPARIKSELLEWLDKKKGINGKTLNITAE